jgi:hypothetical protein
MHVGTDSSRSPLTELEPALKDSETPITERLESSLEILETPAAALEIMRHEDDHGDDGNTPSHLYKGRSTATDRT